MPKCPNCFFELNLHERKLKYKCSKCRSWFLQKDIDTMEFIRINKFEREKERKSLEQEERLNKENKKKQSEFAKRWELTNPHLVKLAKKIQARRWRIEHMDEILDNWGKYYENNKEKVLAKQREYRNREGGQTRKNRLKELYNENIEEERLKSQIKYWKNRQVALALKTFSDEGFKPYNAILSV